MAMSWPLDGAYNKNFKTTSSFGWRVHPIQKTRKHHNGEDLISITHNPAYLKAIYEGTVIEARAAKSKKKNGEPNGYGYFVAISHKIGGKDYVALYAHLRKDSFQVKKGDKVKPGQVLGVMGTTGASTGVHLHLEIHVGKRVGWSDNGSGFLDPIPFLQALEAFDGEIGKAFVATPSNSPTQDIANHTPSARPTKFKAPAAKPKLQGWLKVGSNSEAVAYLQKALKVSVDGIFGSQTKKAVEKFQADNKLVVDGIVGVATWPKITVGVAPTAPAKETSKETPKEDAKAPAKPKLSAYLKQGSRGANVKFLQSRLKITADGIFGANTKAAVVKFQKEKRLAVDGVVGPTTWGRL
jgi:peptidoglycan hydrolase-like protein with peptidoglycan-binding domain